jgi:hypothetical protein
MSWIRPLLFLMACFVCLASAAPQQNPRRLFDDDKTTTPKPIVQIKRLINQQEGDGSYTYGFEADDGSFKIETRDVNGNVKGKYGYVDVNNELKVVEYTAGNGTGFDAQADFLPQPQQPVPHQQAAPAPRAKQSQRAHQQPSRAPEQHFQQQQQQQPQRHQPAPQQTHPQQTEDFRQAFRPSDNGLAHFSDPKGVFQFSFPDPGQPASASKSAVSGVPFDGQYVPSIELEGFSDDADKDGFVDEIPQGHSIAPRERNRPHAAAPPSANFQFGSPTPSNHQFGSDRVAPRPSAPRPVAPQQFAELPTQFRQQSAPAAPQQRPAVHQPQFFPSSQQQAQSFNPAPPQFNPAQFQASPQPQSQFQGFPQHQQFGGPAPQQQQQQSFQGFSPAPGGQSPGRFLSQQQQDFNPNPTGRPGPLFQGQTERPRLSFVNPLSLGQPEGRRPF